MKLILEKDNGEQILVRDDLPDYTSKHSIFYRGDYIAMKLWTEEDVQRQLWVNGYKGTQDEIDAVVNTGELDLLYDCTDYDWGCIDYAINTAKINGDLPERGAADEHTC